jgi:hypothetical protein
MLLSLTRPHEMPGRSLAVCICLSCRLSSAPAAAELVEELAISAYEFRFSLRANQLLPLAFQYP